MAYSKVLHKYYNAGNDSSLYINNIEQICKLLSNHAESEIVDIITIDDAVAPLVFVFKKSKFVEDILSERSDKNGSNP